jgi:hypothetical protein
MSRFRPPLPREVDRLLDHERDISPVPAAVRAHALARARAALVAGTARSPSRRIAAPRRISWAAAAALVCVGGAALGAVAYEIRSRLIDPPSAPPAAPPVTMVAVERALPAPRVADEPSAPPDTHATPHLSRADAARAELRLLRQARAAVARENYAAAMPPIAEHVRRFKAGRLTEEREALRVKALAGLGRTDDAQRAAAAFRARFPRSVLLPAVGQMPARER